MIAKATPSWDTLVFSGINNRIIASPTSDQTDIFSTYEPGSPGTYVYNATGWTRDFDFTGVGWTGRGALISPRHMLFATHVKPVNGATIRFIDPSGTATTRTITATADLYDYDNRANKDISIGYLSADVADGISYYRVLPESNTDYFSYSADDYTVSLTFTALTGKPVLFLDQDRKGRIGQLAWSASGRIQIWKGDSPLDDYWDPADEGDSGWPTFLAFGDELVLMSTHYGAVRRAEFDGTDPTDDAGFQSDYLSSGVSTVLTNAAINEMMSDLGGSYQLTEFWQARITALSPMALPGAIPLFEAKAVADVWTDPTCTITENVTMSGNTITTNVTQTANAISTNITMPANSVDDDVGMGCGNQG